MQMNILYRLDPSLVVDLYKTCVRVQARARAACICLLTWALAERRALTWAPRHDRYGLAYHTKFVRIAQSTITAEVRARAAARVQSPHYVPSVPSGGMFRVFRVGDALFHMRRC